ncbi:MAG: 30S ribosomal protein S17 [Candidatus Woesearchaeota archaeon]
MKQKTKSVGYDIKAPKEQCNDKKCPFHSDIKLRGRHFVGTIISKDVNHSATVEWVKKLFIKKYERYQIKRTRIRVHNPKCIDANVGDKVVLYECRPISKTINSVIVKIMGEDIKYKQKREIIEDDKKISEKALYRKTEENIGNKEREKDHNTPKKDKSNKIEEDNDGEE